MYPALDDASGESLACQVTSAVSPANATTRSVGKNARQRLKRDSLTILGWGMLMVNFPIFMMSDVVGTCEFALPTVATAGRVTEVESFGPWHHRTTFVYDTESGPEEEDSWSGVRPEFDVGSLIDVEHQESDLEHARVVGQRKNMIALWQTGVLPLVGLFFWMIGFVRGRRRIALARTGTLTEATRRGEALVFELVSTKVDAGYRDVASERREVHVPIPKSMSTSPLEHAQKLIYHERHPERALVLSALALWVDKDSELKAEPVSRTRFAVVLVPYIAFSMLLLAYYVSN